jgi:hypothetical protein
VNVQPRVLPARPDILAVAREQVPEGSERLAEAYLTSVGESSRWHS